MCCAPPKCMAIILEHRINRSCATSFRLPIHVRSVLPCLVYRELPQTPGYHLKIDHNFVAYPYMICTIMVTFSDPNTLCYVNLSTTYERGKIRIT